MPFKVCYASETDLQSLSILVFDAFAQNPTHRGIYPRGATPSLISWNVEGDRRGMNEDKNAFYMCVRDIDTESIVSTRCGMNICTGKSKAADPQSQ